MTFLFINKVKVDIRNIILRLFICNCFNTLSDMVTDTEDEKFAMF